MRTSSPSSSSTRWLASSRRRTARGQRALARAGHAGEPEDEARARSGIAHVTLLQAAGPLIIPAPTVALVPSSMRMKLPVWRLRRYSSKKSGTRRPQRDPADLVEPERRALLVAVERVDVEPVLQLLHHRPGRARGVLDGQLRARLRAAAPPSSTPSRRCPAPTVGGLPGRQSMSPRLMSISSVERDVDGHGRERLLHRLARRARWPRMREVKPDGSTITSSPGRSTPPSDLPGVGPVVVELLGHGPDHVLHREAHVDEVAVRGDVHVLQVVQQRRAPGTRASSPSASTTLSPSSAEMGMKVRSVSSSFMENLRNSSLMASKTRLVVVHEVHLVDAQHQVRARAAARR